MRDKYAQCTSHLAIIILDDAMIRDEQVLPLYISYRLETNRYVLLIYFKDSWSVKKKRICDAP